MSSLANTLYARMLQARDIDRQRKLEQERFDREFVDRSMQRNLEERRLTERAQELEFQRHMKVAEAEARAASLGGRGMPPGGYHNAAVGEAARVAYATGQVDREDKLLEQAAKKRDQDIKALDANLDFRASTAGHIAGLEKGGYAELTKFGREQALPAYLDPSQPLPTMDQAISRRLTPDEIQRRRQPRAEVDNERLKHFDKFESYLNQAAAGKEEWAAFSKAGQLRRLAMDLRDYAALGYDLPTAMREMKQRHGWESSTLIDQAAALMGSEEAPALDRLGGGRRAVAGPSAEDDLD